MPDTSKCFSLVRGRVMRVTRLDGCGARVLGPTSTVVSDGFITVGLAPQIEEGQTISVSNAAGNICILDEPPPKFTGYDITVEFCGVNPDLLNLMTGNPVVTDSTVDEQGVGFRVNSGIDLTASGFALEVWSGVPAGVCEPGEETNYGYFLVPFAQGGVVGDISIGNDAVNFTLTGARSKDGSGWGVGPYDVVRDGSSLAAPLKDAIDEKDHLHMELTSVAPPEGVCGATALGVEATGADAGTPGDFTPANSYGPADFADLTANPVTANPATAWTSGQHIVLRDGSLAHWDGAAWVAGAA